jgi:hypothetical protein
MLLLPRPLCLRARPPLRRDWRLAVLVTVAMGLQLMTSAAWARKAPARDKPASAAAAAAPAASESAGRRAAQVETANITELRGRMTSRDLALLRRAEIGDAKIEVWLFQPTRQYYVSVSLQGALRRTLKPVNESEAWLNFDSFRRLAALGDVGRPVLLGQLNPGGAAPSGAGAGSGAGPTAPGQPVSLLAQWAQSGAPPGQAASLLLPPTSSSPDHNPAPNPAPNPALNPSLKPGLDLKTVPVPPERLGAPDAVDDMDLERVRQARDAYVGAAAPPVARASASAALVPAPAEAQQVAGQAVETLRRERIGEEVARLVWSPDSGHYTASLTRQGRVVGMFRSPDRQVAITAFDDLVKQSQARAVASAAQH